MHITNNFFFKSILSLRAVGIGMIKINTSRPIPM
jgi:hypothetical protein